MLRSSGDKGQPGVASTGAQGSIIQVDLGSTGRLVIVRSAPRAKLCLALHWRVSGKLECDELVG
jgi:hypothetical protein